MNSSVSVTMRLSLYRARALAVERCQMPVRSILNLPMTAPLTAHTRDDSRVSDHTLTLSADVSYTLGPVTAKVTVNYAWSQKALALDQGASGLLKNNDNVYLAGDLSAAIPNTPPAYGESPCI